MRSLLRARTIAVVTLGGLVLSYASARAAAGHEAPPTAPISQKNHKNQKHGTNSTGERAPEGAAAPAPSGPTAASGPTVEARKGRGHF